MTTEDNFSTLGVNVSLFRRQRGGPLYYYFTYGGDIHRASTKKMSTRDARDVATAAVREATATPVAQRGSLMLAEAITEMLLDRWPQKSGRTFLNVKNRLEAFSAWAGATDLATLNGEGMRSAIKKYLTERFKTVGARTVKNEQLVLSNFCTWLMTHDAYRALLGWPMNPADARTLGLPRPKIAERILPKAEVLQSFFDKVKLTDAWPVVVMCAGSVARPIGAMRVTWEDVDFKASTITLREKNTVRTIPLGRWASAELQAWKTAHPDNPKPFMSNEQSAMRTLTSLQHDVPKGKRITLQTLRMLAANQLMDVLDTRAYADITGHSLKTADRHYRAKRQSTAHAEVSAALDWGKRGEDLGKK